MDRNHFDDFGSATRDMRSRMHEMLDAYEQSQTQIGEVQRQLVDLRVQAATSDGSVHVTVDSAGAVLEVCVTPAAMRGTAGQLSGLLTDTAREAARLAKEQTAAVVAPLADLAGGMPDLSELVPGAPEPANDGRTMF
ncbi:YbaB/EbfC family nucleoid-associated protein [Nocardia fusca]|uniref:YbaB/EbfC family nucleoid-associated protein n=1 Tax=Nocardia fusca TaxID=941183 RepID=UPI0007A735B1|nr:YbaB/EbfC family nucleoid-associated protein [Nocardia fusca]